MVDKRPININPLSIKLPLSAWVSISHRLSGVLNFLLIPVLLWLLQISLESNQSFDTLASYMQMWSFKFLLFVLIASFIFHLVAGIRHLLMDMHIADSLIGGRLTSWLTILASAVLIVATFIWLWS